MMKDKPQSNPKLPNYSYKLWKEEQLKKYKKLIDAAFAESDASAVPSDV